MPRIPKRLVTFADLLFTLVFITVATPIFLSVTMVLAAYVSVKTPFLAARAAVRGVKP